MPKPSVTQRLLDGAGYAFLPLGVAVGRAYPSVSSPSGAGACSICPPSPAASMAAAGEVPRPDGFGTERRVERVGSEQSVKNAVGHVRSPQSGNSSAGTVRHRRWLSSTLHDQQPTPGTLVVEMRFVLPNHRYLGGSMGSKGSSRPRRARLGSSESSSVSTATASNRSLSHRARILVRKPTDLAPWSNWFLDARGDRRRPVGEP